MHKTYLKENQKNIFASKRACHLTSAEYYVAAQGGAIKVIDEAGNFRPSGIWGNTYFVDYANGQDTNSGLTAKAAFKTYSRALAQVTSNNNDLVVIDGNATVVETAMISNAKSRFSTLGVGGGLLYGMGAKVEVNVTTATTDIATYLNAGSTRVTHSNVKFINGNTLSQALWGVAEGGEYAVYQNCEFYKSTQLSVSISAEMLLNADSAQFFNCTFGSLADAKVGAVLRPAVWLGNGVVGAGLVCRDVTFKDCLFWNQASNTIGCMVYAPNAGDVQRQMLFKGCGFINNAAASAVPAQAIKTAATLNVGAIICDPNCFVANCTKLSTSTGVFVTGPSVNSGTGIAVNAA